MATTQVQVQKKEGINAFLNREDVKQNIASVLGDMSKTSTFITSVVSAVNTNPALKECSNASIMAGALLGESLKLTPSPQMGQYYLVPYGSKNGGKEAQFQLGAKGYIQLAIRSGQYKRLVTSVVKEGELKSYNPITEKFEFEPVMDMSKREKLPVIGYYAMFELMNGYVKELYWSKEKMEKHATTYSKAYAYDKKNNTKSSFWAKDDDAYNKMAEKTMLRQLISKWGIMSIDMQRAFEGDMGVVKEDGTVEYVDNELDPIEQRNEDVQNANTTDFIDVDAKVKKDANA